MSLPEVLCFPILCRVLVKCGNASVRDWICKNAGVKNGGICCGSTGKMLGTYDLLSTYACRVSTHSLTLFFLSSCPKPHSRPNQLAHYMSTSRCTDFTLCVVDVTVVGIFWYLSYHVVIVIVLWFIIGNNSGSSFTVNVGSGAANWRSVSTPTSDFCRQATASNPHSLREQVVGIWCREKHG